MKDNLSSQDSYESLASCGVLWRPIIVPHASEMSLNTKRGLLYQFEGGQTLLKAHGVQGGASQRCCKPVKIHRGA